MQVERSGKVKLRFWNSDNPDNQWGVYAFADGQTFSSNVKFCDGDNITGRFFKQGPRLRLQSLLEVQNDFDRDKLLEFVARNTAGVGKATLEKLFPDQDGNAIGAIMDQWMSTGHLEIAVPAGIGQKKLQALHDAWEATMYRRILAMQLIQASAGQLTMNECAKLSCKVSDFREDPYQALERKLPFSRIDEISRGLDIEQNDLRRLGGAAREVLLHKLDGGELFLHEQTFYMKLRELLRGDYDRQALRQIQSIVFEEQRVWHLHLYRMHYEVSDWLCSLNGDAEPRLYSGQEEAVARSLESGLFLIYGPAGTGKTTTIGNIAKQVNNSLFLLAPTGKAASRLREKCNEQTYTLHRFAAMYAEKRVTDATIIVDEAPMISTDMLHMLLCNIDTSSCSLILVGDQGQLPPVNNGRVFIDLLSDQPLLKVRAPRCALEEVHRQENNSVLLNNAERIYRKTARRVEDLEFHATQFRHYDSDEVENDTKRMELVTQLAGQYDDYQVICPQRSHAETMNKDIRELKNPGDGPEEQYRVGDVVICNKNTYAEGELLVANGEMGRVDAVEEKQVSVHFEMLGRKVSFGDKFPKDSIQLGYVLTCHKAQGSEWPGVIIVLLDDTSDMMLRRNWFYTAVTRAKESVIIIGSSRKLNRCLSK